MRRRLEFSVLLEQLGADVPAEVRPSFLRVLYSIESDLFPEREDLAVLLVHLVRREQERRSAEQAARRPKKIVRTNDVPVEKPKPKDDRPIRSAFHDRIREGEEGETQVEGPIARLLRRRLGVKSDTKGRRRPDDE